ncbi:MAG: IS66 family transposase [Ktedonobacterales bacterium]|nr:IS66 family transposase [Ktedonobacterales bacterium]
MSEQERVAQLEAENASLRQQLAGALAVIARLEATVACQAERITALEGRLAKDSHNSSKPPASDGLAHRPHPRRVTSGRRSGGQPGHPGQTLTLVEMPDVVVTHAPSCRIQCQHELAGVPGRVVERRQVHDVPPLRLEVTEHQAVAVRCPVCQVVTCGTFPPEVTVPAQYGARLRAVAVYLNQYQLVPEERTHEALADLFGCTVSDGSIATWVDQIAGRLAPTVARIADFVAAGPHQHADETGVRIAGRLHWLHVNSTRWLTHLAWHPKRGKEALEAIGIWPRFHGRATHDRWARYDAYHACHHSWCGAHLVRDLTVLAEEQHQGWAEAVRDLLLAMHAAAQQWRAHGAAWMPVQERAEWIAAYHELVAQGYATHPPPSPPATGSSQRGRRKQSPAKHLLDALLGQADRVLAFLADLRVPFTNNQAERDLRMVKVQQKISGTFRSEAGATAHCRIRSYLGTMRKQGQGMLDALTAAFLGRPFPIAQEY